ncbi:MAG TPA: hypothetical protein VGB63_14440 [Pedobacter sp.]|jgi:hypothetical protein
MKFTKLFFAKGVFLFALILGASLSSKAQCNVPEGYNYGYYSPPAPIDGYLQYGACRETRIFNAQCNELPKITSVSFSSSCVPYYGGSITVYVTTSAPVTWDTSSRSGIGSVTVTSSGNNYTFQLSNITNPPGGPGASFMPKNAGSTYGGNLPLTDIKFKPL